MTATDTTVNAATDQANRKAVAAIAAANLKARAGRSGALAHTSTSQIAETLVDLDDNIFAASATLWSMDEDERMEALGLDQDDPKSYLAAKYGMAS
ncbi:hypothetical protein NG697_12585 [Pseudarthrobacter sp. MDT3-26]|nr:hypothetical protein [Pseudarthrobacter sp. MDT3-26]